MKKIIALLLIVLTTFTLSSCFLFGDVTIHPDMVEYTEKEILEVAKDKYGVTEWIFTGIEILGETWYDTEGTFKLEFYDEQFSTEFTNGDNIEAAMQAFAGKNGNHDVQGRYSRFLCCVALGKCTDGSLKFVYYNTNIHKDAEIADTIGASDYTFEVLPNEITNNLFTVDSRWTSMQLFLNDYKDGHPRGFYYSGERLTRRHNEKYNGYIELEFYKENGKVVYDIYYTKDEQKPEERRLVYSTSDRYDVIYNYYGLDKSEHFDITQTVTQSTEQESCMAFKAQVEAKEIDGTVLYSRFLYSAEYYVKRDGGAVLHGTANETVIDKLNFECGWMLDKIDGVDHAETAKFYLSHFYIFYEKNLKN
ncbi:MAG: hypothetical protein E7625_02660 [Ruminococcaceae bacterium]|nr:hypothetical protein [Oscillospiraceae bacterium]